MAKDRPDVLLIGGGIAGCAIAYQLATAGIRTTMLEQGPIVRDADRPILSRDWEYALGREWHYDPNVRQLPADYPIIGDGLQPYVYNAVGGSSNHYAGFWHRLKPVDFRKGTEHGVEGSLDWPISYEELAPYYDANDELFGISGYPGDPMYPVRETTRLPLLRHGVFAERVARAFDELRWHWWPGDCAIASVPFGDRLPCNGCGHCNAGCPRGSLATAEAVYLREAVRRGLDLRTNTRAIAVTTDSGGAASGAEYVDVTTGAMHRIEARVVVVACNAFGSPRLLLHSANESHPAGLGNEHDLVGRHLMLHGWLMTDVWLSDRTEHYKGPTTASVYCQEFYDTDVSRDCVNGFTITAAADFGPAHIGLGGATGLSPVDWGANHHDDFDKRFGHHLFLSVQSDDLPVSTNRVTLDDTITDATGMPAARAKYALHENDRRLLRFAQDRVAELGATLGDAEVEHLDLEGPYVAPGWHPMGTCRMGVSPEDSVTDKWHRVWSVPGLLVCDSSSFTTGGAANPAATVAALGLRCGEFLVNHANRAIAVAR